MTPTHIKTLSLHDALPISFSFQDIPLGQYKVTVTATGFPVYTVDKVEVVAGQIYTLNDFYFVQDRKSTRLNSSHRCISYAVFCLKKKIYIFLFYTFTF